MDLSKPAPKLKEQPLRWRVQVTAGLMGESGFAEFDPKSGQLTKIELAPSQVRAKDYLEPANTQELLANMKEDFGQGAQFKEISIDHRGATVKAAAPPHPDEIQEYTYNEKERAEPAASLIKSPFDQNFDRKDLFGAGEFQGFESRLSELEKKTLDRLRISGGQISWLTFFRQSPFYPRNKKVLLEIRVKEAEAHMAGLFTTRPAQWSMSWARETPLTIEQPFRLTAPLFADENKDAGSQRDNVEQKNGWP